jgi:hypothetical protein
MGGEPESVNVLSEEPAKTYRGEWEFLRAHPPSMIGSLDPAHLNFASRTL